MNTYVENEIGNKINMYSVYDIKAESYGRPYIIGTHAEAIREFSRAVNQEKSVFGANPEDYSLHYIGNFNQTSGQLIPLINPQHLSHATEHKK